MSKKQIIILISIIFLGIFLLFFRLGRHDMLGDDAHYAFRSIGYFDYMASKEQTTPMQWFGHKPWWSFLSYHDHPPLYFAIQYLFFQIFGVSLITSRLVSVMTALGSILVLFFLAKHLGGVTSGLFAAGALVLNSYFIWMGRIGLLESLFTFFLLLGLLFFIKSIKDDEKYFLATGFFLGLSFLTKYTLFFVLPGILVYLIWKKRWFFLNRKFWLGALVFLIICAPVIVYNLAMYKARGHFDVQFSDLFGQQHNDWTGLESRISGLHFNPLGTIKILISGFSWPYFLFFLMSIIGSFYLARKKSDTLICLPILIFLSLLIFFTLIGAAARWLGVMSPFAALVIAFILNEFRPSKLFISMVLVLVLFCLFYTLNTNTFKKPIGGPNLYSDFRVENYGYNQLDKKISKLLTGTGMSSQVRQAVGQWWYNDLDQESINFVDLRRFPNEEFNSMIIYDSNTSWFPTLWIFERWKLYRRFLIPNSEEYLKIAKDENAVKFLNSVGLEGVYLIQAGKEVAKNSGIDFPETSILVQNFKDQGIEPEIIYDDKGREAFYIYHGGFK